MSSYDFSYSLYTYAGFVFIAANMITYDQFFGAMSTTGASFYLFFMAHKYMVYLSQAKDDLNKTVHVMEIESIIDPLRKPDTAEPKLTGKIEFVNVDFSYPTTGKKIFSGLTFTIQAGQNVGIVGPSGSGKSTIIQLLERFYEINSGDIKFDGVSIKDYDLLELRNNIAIVPQDPTLFKISILENIRYGNPNASMEEVEKIAEVLKIDKELLSLVEDENTVVSGGEKQRIIIARAALKNHKIMLLDEATSSLDVKTESITQSYLENTKGKRTTITVAHKLSTIEKCDVIFVLDEGKLVEFGTSEQLYAAKGKALITCISSGIFSISIYSSPNCSASAL